MDHDSYTGIGVLLRGSSTLSVSQRISILFPWLIQAAGPVVTSPRRSVRVFKASMTIKLIWQIKWQSSGNIWPQTLGIMILC